MNTFLGGIGATGKTKKTGKKVYQHFGVNFFTGKYSAAGNEEFINKEYRIQRSDYGVALNYLAKKLRKNYPGEYFEIYYNGEYYY